MDSFWSLTIGRQLAQGDLLPDGPIPSFGREFDGTEHNLSIPCRRDDAIILTQTCDLLNQKTVAAALCPALTIAGATALDPNFGRAATLEEIRKGRYPALHMLGAPDKPDDNSGVRIVDFRLIHSLPVPFLAAHAGNLGQRWRLRSPFLEHFSQAFARFFMRVGLPSDIPKFYTLPGGE